MTETWSKPLGVTDPNGPDYWDYFGARLVEQAGVQPGFRILDIGCGAGPSLFPAAQKTGPRGIATGIDICPN